MPVSVQELLDSGARRLAHVASPRKEAGLLLAHALGVERNWVVTHPDALVESGDFDAFVARREAHEPIEYIVGEVSFYSQNFFADSRALIARPETELLIDAVLAKVPADFAGTIVEVGIGSGIISIVLAQKLPYARIVGLDISPLALELAAKNIARYGLTQRIELGQSDLLDNYHGAIDVLVSNPPYIALDVALEKPLGYEPQNALFGGSRGDELIVRLLQRLYSDKIALFACEMGYDQRANVMEYCANRDGYGVEFYSDYAGHDRGFVIQTKER
ncbi:MAG: hypothetical protein KU28_00175 [Sulfurovum sp. PC08-66]|nr:MAG: hypothetical protein KU28_00175 [Sulfurovum sp. PC08-66]KIM12389.1 MAG: hypothetical protein KU37_00295 [Sulfuricurvum sp. PC08-66]